ncbi:MAG TPA: formylmethanofuran dehydrogenase subunit C, partial [Methylomirabilota bacterium]|nr:formylmethanofuran dehydrogenase subunit C [Methylomirabilota bacterium]
GDAGDFAGAMMLAGTILVRGTPGIRAGAGLKRGTLVTLGGGARAGGDATPFLLSTFRLDCEYRPVWLALYLRQIAGWDVPGLEAVPDGVCRRYSGDLTELGKGELLVWISR